MSRAYSKAFKQQIIAERLKGSSCEALAKTHQIGVSTIHKWMNHYKKQNKPEQKLINITSMIHDQDIRFKINGYEIIANRTNLEQILKALRS